MAAQTENLGTKLMVLMLVLSIVAFLVVLVRSIYRLKDRHYGADDICSGFAALLFLIIASMVSWSAVRGVYKPKGQITLEQTELGIRTNTISQAALSAAEALGKISIALLQIRILARTFLWKRVVLWTIIAITVVFTIFTICVSFFQCKIPRAVWDLRLKAHTSCWSPAQVSLQAVITSSWYTAVDFLLAAFPLVLFWDLHVPLKKKVAVLVLLGLGIITGIFSALKTALLPVLAKNSADSNAQFQLQLFTGIELFLLIVLGCVPVMKRPWEILVDRSPHRFLISSLRRLLTRRTSSVYSDETEGKNKEYTNQRNDSVVAMEPVKDPVKAAGIEAAQV